MSLEDEMIPEGATHRGKVSGFWFRKSSSDGLDHALRWNEHGWQPAPDLNAQLDARFDCYGRLCPPIQQEQTMKYKQLKPISLKAIIQAQGDVRCEEFWTGYLAFEDWVLDQVKATDDDWAEVLTSSELEWSLIEEYVNSHPRAAQFLVKHGFIEEERTLKPCPFCGSEKIITGTNGYIYCDFCKATVYADSISSVELIEKWNKRV